MASKPMQVRKASTEETGWSPTEEIVHAVCIGNAEVVGSRSEIPLSVGEFGRIDRLFAPLRPEGRDDAGCVRGSKP